MDKIKINKAGLILRFLWGIFFLFLSLPLASFAQVLNEEVVDCLAAVVDGHPISLFDLKVIESFQLLGSDPEIYQTKENVLNEYINRLLVLELARGQMGVNQEELKQELERLNNRLGQLELKRKLASFGMKEADLIPYLQNKILYDKIINSRFNQKMYISLKEIEAYYQQVFVPEEKAKGRTPAELINVLNEIEARLQKMKADQQLKEWIQELRERADIILYLDCLKKK